MTAKQCQSRGVVDRGPAPRRPSASPASRHRRRQCRAGHQAERLDARSGPASAWRRRSSHCATKARAATDRRAGDGRSEARQGAWSQQRPRASSARSTSAAAMKADGATTGIMPWRSPNGAVHQHEHAVANRRRWRRRGFAHRDVEAAAKGTSNGRSPRMLAPTRRSGADSTTMAGRGTRGNWPRWTRGR